MTFAVQDLIADAPFSRMDLISCRNLLIYLEPEVQKNLINLFHFALADGGTLFLGSSESIGRQAEAFEPVSKKWRIYRRIGPRRADDLQFPVIKKESRQRRIAGGWSPPTCAQIGRARARRVVAPLCSGLRRD